MAQKELSTEGWREWEEEEEDSLKLVVGILNFNPQIKYILMYQIIFCAFHALFPKTAWCSKVS
jgi:hypothetical protein